MASPRLQPPDIQKDIAPTEHLKPILQTLQTNTYQVLFRPPTISGQSPSPLKKITPGRHRSHQEPHTKVLEPPPSKLKSINLDVVQGTENPMKRPPTTIFDTAIPPRKPPQAALFTTFPTSKSSVGKENIAPNGYFKDITNSVTNISKRKESLSKGAVARVLQEAATAKTEKEKENDGDKVKEKDGAASPVNATIPEPEDMPLVMDDGKKPPYSYATLIGMAILRAPGRRLTLAQIYKWISDTFEYYRTSESGWQNSIRHNLSLNKAFEKQERPKDDPGKGHYWIIVPGEERPFLNKKSGRRPASSGHTKKASISSNSSKRRSSNALDSFDPPVLPPPHSSSVESGVEELPKAPESAATIDENETKDGQSIPQFEDAIDFSSDATQILSPEPEQAMFLEDPFRPSSPPQEAVALSSPPPVPTILHSSPPVTRMPALRDSSPPPPPFFPPPTRKRKMSLMNDSGYFSSLESSVQRQSMNEDRHRIKRGRAEEDIARLRSSSHPHESPIPKSKLSGNYGSLVSSPLRKYDTNPMLPPLTPATFLRPRQKTPLSASPNTNLRLHRELVKRMVGSPCRDVPTLDDEEWTSYFTTFCDGKFCETEENLEINEILAKGCFSSPAKGELKSRDLKRSCTSAAELLAPTDLDLFDEFYSPARNATQRIRQILEENGSPRPLIKRSETVKF